MAAPLGVGIIGLSADGGWGARAHLPALQSLDGFVVRGLSASSKEAAQRAQRQFGIDLAVDDPHELAHHPDIDLVAICVRVPQHAELVRACTEAGKTVYCEWPLARTLAEAQELAALASGAGLHTAVGLQARSTPTVRYLRDLIAEGYIGDVLSTTLVGSGGGWADTCTVRSSYTFDRASGASMLTVPLGHTLDALTYVLGPIHDVSATAGIRRPYGTNTETGEQVIKTAHDQIAVHGTLDSGAIYAAHYRGGLSAGTNFLWEVNGTAADIVLRGPTGHLQFGQARIFGAQHGADLEPMPVPTTYLRTPDPLADSGASTVAHAYAHLLQDIEEGTHTVPDFEHAVAHHQTLEAIEASALHGSRSVL
ncbi:Gfo/Idh/MocA family protein [Streptomyces sp. NPDC017056]|uniref:Gfo/Idh/MocA family protein n=1 Tax=Streptomyces sp. NPDC017056 TaxID=3364973 RepID=UPI003794A05B